MFHICKHWKVGLAWREVGEEGGGARIEFITERFFKFPQQCETLSDVVRAGDLY